jgi:hypothetical protein
MFNDNGSFLLALFEFFIFFAWIMCVFYVFADIFRSHDMGGGGKTVWCLFVIFVPFLGVLVYLIAIRSRRPSNSSTRERSPRPSSTR